MSPVAVLRVGSLEIVGAMALFAAVAARIRPPAGHARAESLEVALLVRESGRPGGAHPLTVSVSEGVPALLGRSKGAAVALADPEVSRRHARLELEDGVLYLSDWDSRNGTFLNGKPVGEEGIELRNGDAIDVGNTRITITKTEPKRWT